LGAGPAKWKQISKSLNRRLWLAIKIFVCLFICKSSPMIHCGKRSHVTNAEFAKWFRHFTSILEHLQSSRNCIWVWWSSWKKCQSSLIFYCKIPILCQSSAKSAQILLVMSDRTDTFRELCICHVTTFTTMYHGRWFAYKQTNKYFYCQS
jgi:hypothetical protein